MIVRVTRWSWSLWSNYFKGIVSSWHYCCPFCLWVEMCVWGLWFTDYGAVDNWVLPVPVIVGSTFFGILQYCAVNSIDMQKYIPIHLKYLINNNWNLIWNSLFISVWWGNDLHIFQTWTDTSMIQSRIHVWYPSLFSLIIKRQEKHLLTIFLITKNEFTL